MKTYCFGIDVGGTSVKCGLFHTDGTLVEKWEIPTRTENNGQNILPDVAETINAKLAEKNIDKADVEGVGIGIPGPINSRGEAACAVNLYWGFTPVAQILGDLTGLKAQAGNDANVAALGEAWKGAAAGAQNIIMITLGTGVAEELLSMVRSLQVLMVPVVRSVTLLLSAVKKRNVTAVTVDAWSSTLPLQVSYAWLKGLWLQQKRKQFSETSRIFLPRMYWMLTKTVIKLQRT